MVIEQRGISVLKPETSPPGVLSFCTTRRGGFSSGDFDSLNMGFFTDDPVENVIRNHELVKQAFAVPRIVTLKQVHGGLVQPVDSPGAPATMFMEADGLITDERNLGLGILTADCFSVQIIGSRAVAALHCGWRSVHANIINHAIRLFSEYRDTPYSAVVGPGICGDCYEVGDDLLNTMAGSHNITPHVSMKGERDTPHLDIRSLIVSILHENDITDIRHINECSRCSDLLYSHRGDDGRTGRMMSVIMRNPV